MSEGLEPKFTLSEVAQNLRVDERTLRRRLRENPQIRPIRAGRTRLFTRSDITELEEALKERYDKADPEEIAEAAKARAEGRSVANALRALRTRRSRGRGRRIRWKVLGRI
jgi:hypothetical protein